MKRYLNLAFLLTVAINALAGIPEGYYTSADNKKCTDLKDALCKIIANHKTLGYSSLWTYYPSTYYVPTNKTQVLDMYSNTVRYYSGTSAVSGMNKEHTVPKSWWGGSTAAAPGNDLYNVIPSDQYANSAKSNYPLGIVSGTASFDNGVTKIGQGTVNGYTGNMFEPKDDYKGDFARIYFYMATCYPDLAWDSSNAIAMTNSSSLTLKAWIIPMLIQWSANDPVDDAEIQRNEDIYKCQGNRNPFIDYPSLIDYIWGTKTDVTFSFSDHDSNTGEDSQFTTGTPTFSVDYGTKDNPKSVTDSTVVKVKGCTTTATLYTRVNGGEWVETKCDSAYNKTSGTYYHIAAFKNFIITGETCIEAYCTQDGYLNSDTIIAYYNGVNYSDDYLLYESFDGLGGNNTSNTGSSTEWNGDDDFPTTNKAYCAGNAIKIGSSSAAGSIKSRTLATTGGTLTVQIDVKGWTTVEGDLKVTLTGADTQTVTYTATMSSADFEHLNLTFTNVSANPTLTIATTAKRAFVDNIIVQQAQQTTKTGDVNGDNLVNVADVTALVDIILGKSASVYAADVNGDNLVNVADVTAIVDIILGR